MFFGDQRGSLALVVPSTSDELRDWPEIAFDVIRTHPGGGQNIPQRWPLSSIVAQFFPWRHGGPLCLTSWVEFYRIQARAALEWLPPISAGRPHMPIALRTNLNILFFARNIDETKRALRAQQAVTGIAAFAFHGG